MKYWRRLRLATARLAPFLILGLLSRGAALAQDARAELESLLDEIVDLTASFEESLYDADGELLDISSGRFSLLRPGRFVWHYDEPFEYIVVADGDSLWTYDVEFEQVTRAPISDLDNSPFMLLSGDGRLGDAFDVANLPSADGRRWIEMSPRDGSADFSAARIAFADGVPGALELVDSLSQLTRIDFEEIEINGGIDRELFEFEPPPGVNVAGLDD